MKNKAKKPIEYYRYVGC